MTEVVRSAPLGGGQPGLPPGAPAGDSVRIRRLGGPDLPLLALAALFAVFLGLPVVTLVVRSIVDGSLGGAAGSDAVLAAHVVEAIGYRSLDRKLWAR